MDKKKDLADKLRSSGLRQTKQRVKLAKYLFKKDKTFIKFSGILFNFCYSIKH